MNWGLAIMLVLIFYNNLINIVLYVSFMIKKKGEG